MTSTVATSTPAGTAGGSALPGWVAPAPVDRPHAEDVRVRNHDAVAVGAGD